MATINKKQIPELDPVGIYLDDTDEFVVFDNRENSLGNSKARRVSYGELKDNLINPEIEMVGGIKYNFQDENDSTLVISNDKIILEPATHEKDGYMSHEDKEHFDQIMQTDVGKLTNGFNTKVRATSSSPSELVNINTIQGDGTIITSVVTDNDEKILHVAFDRNKLINDSRTKVNYNGSEKNLDYLTFDDNGLIITQTTSPDQKNTYKIGLDTDRIIDSITVDASIKADIGEEEKNFSKLVPGENIQFSESEEGNLIITGTGTTPSEDEPSEDTEVTGKNKVYICNTNRTNVHKVISDSIEQGEIFTVYFSNTFAGDSSGEDLVYLKDGQNQEKPIYYNNSVFSLQVINRYATFIKEANNYSLLSTDTSVGKAVRTSVEYENGSENLILYDGTQYSFVNNLNQTSVVQLNNNQKIDNDYLDIFDNGKIRQTLLPTSGGGEGGSGSTIGWPIGYATALDSNNTYIVDLPTYTLSEGNLVAVRFQEAPVLRYFNLNINNTGARPVSYHGSTDFNNTIFDNADIALFIFDGSSYVLLSVDAVVGDSINISTQDYLTSISPRKDISSITLLNSNLLDENNHIREEFLPVVDEDYLNRQDIFNNTTGTIQTNLLPITVGTGLNIDTTTIQNTFSIGLDLPTEQNNPAGLFLNGSGYWSQVPTLRMPDNNNEYQTIETISSETISLDVSGSNLSINYTPENILSDNLKQQIINIMYPVGSYYYTYDSGFSPNGGRSDIDVIFAQDWTYGGQYLWIKDSFTQNNQTVYRWRKTQDPDYTP